MPLLLGAAELECRSEDQRRVLRSGAGWPPTKLLPKGVKVRAKEEEFGATGPSEALRSSRMGCGFCEQTKDVVHDGR